MWRTTEDGPVLVGSRCPRCGLSAFPERDFCRRCFAATMETAELSRTGVLYSWTVVHVAPAGFPTPYVLGYVDLPDGVRVLAQLDADPATLQPGQALTMRIGPVRADGDGSPVDGYRFAALPAGRAA